MKIDIDHHDEGPILPEDPEYQRLRRIAASAYVAEALEAWQMACAERRTR
jgi:hypothetical protein